MRRAGRGRLRAAIECAELLLVDQPVAVDPLGECFERGGVEVHRATLGVAGARDEAGLLEHLDVLRDRLLGDLERFGELVDRGRPAAQAGDDAATHRVGQRHEGAVEAVVGARIHDHHPPPISSSVINHLA